MTFQVSIEPSGHTFTLDPAGSILDGALADGLMLKHSCREGTCGSCKCKVVSGTVDHADSALDVLSVVERAEGFALTCRARATSDLVLDAPEVGELRGIGIQETAARVGSIDKVSDDVAIVRLMLPPGGPEFRYIPGQYVDVQLKDGTRRSYSMASRLPVDNQLQLHIRHMPHGKFSGHVFETLKPREMVRLVGPYGSFYLRHSERPMIFLASGTGFAPIQALLEQLREIDNQRPVFLYWGGRQRQDLYRHQQLIEWEAEHSWLRYTPVLSESTPADDWQGATGFVHQQVIRDFPTLKGYEVYACGAPIVVDSARHDYVAQLELDPQDFYADAFV